MFETSIKNDFYGRHGVSTYSDNSVSTETKLQLLRQIGYVSNRYFEFHSWLQIGNPIAELLPFSLILKTGPYAGMEFYFNSGGTISVGSRGIYISPVESTFENKSLEISSSVDSQINLLKRRSGFFPASDFTWLSEGIKTRYLPGLYYSSFIHRWLYKGDVVDFDCVEIGKVFIGTQFVNREGNFENIPVRF